ncbi:unnamed protein product [Musa acuminata subsp. burmannicoides]
MGAETAAREVVPNQPTTPMRPNTCLPLSDTTPSSFPDTCSDSPSHPHLPIQRIPVRADLNLSHMTAQPKTGTSFPPLISSLSPPSPSFPLHGNVRSYLWWPTMAAISSFH